MEFVVEGKAYWAFTHKPYELAQENYQLMLAPDAETGIKRCVCKDRSGI
jgi:hypothetical protein